MSLQAQQFGAMAAPYKKHAVPFRTLAGDLLDARGRVQAAVRTEGADAETPSWLLPAKYQPKK